jgi:hypothetical protein
VVLGEVLRARKAHLRDALRATGRYVHHQARSTREAAGDAPHLHLGGRVAVPRIEVFHALLERLGGPAREPLAGELERVGHGLAAERIRVADEQLVAWPDHALDHQHHVLVLSRDPREAQLCAVPAPLTERLRGFAQGFVHLAPVEDVAFVEAQRARYAGLLRRLLALEHDARDAGGRALVDAHHQGLARGSSVSRSSNPALTRS